MAIIESLDALEVLDSRGRPTVRVTCALLGGAVASASVPSGASTGMAEANELRDDDARRYGGLGCRRAVANVRGELHDALHGADWNQTSLDAAMCELDGSPNKARLGANAILAVSLAFARAAACEQGVSLHKYFAQAAGNAPRTLPRLTVNLFSGGKHAGGQVAIQDVLLVPITATSVDESLAMIYAVYQAAAQLIHRKYGMRLLRADEGGLAPPCPNVEAMLDDAVQSVRDAGYEPGRDVALAIDVASSHFYRDAKYFVSPSEALDSAGMIARVEQWVANYPIVSVEDGLAEDDWQWWPHLREALAGRALVLGDDFLCTNPARICRAVEACAADALLLKVNQIGTVSQALEAWGMAKSAGWRVTVSARSGETEDDWLADLSVGWSADQIKIGSITQSERLAKYNRLLQIEADEAWPLVSWP